MLVGGVPLTSVQGVLWGRVGGVPCGLEGGESSGVRGGDTMKVAFDSLKLGGVMGEGSLGRSHPAPFTGDGSTDVGGLKTGVTGVAISDFTVPIFEGDGLERSQTLPARLHTLPARREQSGEAHGSGLSTEPTPSVQTPSKLTLSGRLLSREESLLSCVGRTERLSQIICNCFTVF